jgi:hypothetical protein
MRSFLMITKGAAPSLKGRRLKRDIIMLNGWSNSGASCTAWPSECPAEN